MIIIYNTSLNIRDDHHELLQVANYINQQSIPHQIIQNYQLINDIPITNEHAHTLILLGHSNGTLNKLAGFTAHELVMQLYSFINDRYKKEQPIRYIEIAACNLGRDNGTEPSFLLDFAEELSKYIIQEIPIQIKAPNGVLIYTPAGVAYTLIDENPLSLTYCLQSELSSIDADADDAVDSIRPFLEPEPFKIAWTFSIPFALRSINRLTVDLSLDEAPLEPPLQPTFSAGFFNISNAAYNKITKFYSLGQECEHNDKNDLYYK